MAPTFHPLRPVEFFVLSGLTDRDRHGYGLVEAIEQRTLGKVRLRPGDLYRVLHRLQDRGLLEVAGRRPAEELEDQRRTYYCLTTEGRRVLRQQAEVMASVAAGVLAETGSEVS